MSISELAFATFGYFKLESKHFQICSLKNISLSTL